MGWFSCLLVNENSKVSANELRNILSENGIDTRPFFIPLSEMQMWKNNKHADNKVAKQVYSQGINLPSGVCLSETQVFKICQVIKTAV